MRNLARPSIMSLASEGSAWYRCKLCNAVFKLKNLMIRHLKTRHVLPDRPEWELDNNDDKCVSWWERVIVEGTTVRSLPKPVEPPNSDPCLNLDDPSQPLTFSIAEVNLATGGSSTLVLSEDAKKFRCDLCSGELWFAFKKSLYAHLLKNHDRGLCKEPGMNLCRFCGFRAESPAYLKAHVRTHTGDNEEDSRLVECAAHCGRVFSSKASMKKHVRFKCAEAKRLGLDEVIVAEGSVQGYQGDGTSPVPKTNPHVLRQSATDLPWKCNHCVETFPTHARLTGHLAVHSGDLYRCRYCSAPFAHVHTRGAHETNAHNDELGYGYRCPVCSKNFANIATIRGHYKYTHWLDLPPREEIENWRIGTGNLAQDEVEEVQQQHQPEHHQQVVILQAHPLSQHSVQVQQSLIPVHHVVEEAGSNFHFIMQPHHQPQSHPQSHQEPPPHQQQHTSMNMGQGLRMPVGGGGVSLSQITMGTLIGHMPVGQPQIPPPPLPSRAVTTLKKTGKPRGPRNNKVSSLPKPTSKASDSRKKLPNKKLISTPGGKAAKNKKTGNVAKIERKKFHCRKSGCEAKFQRRWELTWHLERVHGEFSCEFCSIPAFSSKSEMLAHQYQIHHRELGCYECRLCGIGLESPRGVQQHVASQHQSSPVPLTLEAKMWRRGAIHRKRVQRPEGGGGLGVTQG